MRSDAIRCAFANVREGKPARAGLRTCGAMLMLERAEGWRPAENPRQLRDRNSWIGRGSTQRQRQSRRGIATSGVAEPEHVFDYKGLNG